MEYLREENGYESKGLVWWEGLGLTKCKGKAMLIFGGWVGMAALDYTKPTIQ